MSSVSPTAAVKKLACCPPLLAGKLTMAEAADLALIFRVLAEPARLQILSLIAAQPKAEVCACELVETLGLTQPTVSHHLKVMYGAGLLHKERRGTWIYYSIVQEQLASLRRVIAPYDDTETPLTKIASEQ